MRYTFKILISSLIVFSLASCEPDQDYLVDVDYSKAAYVIQDNFNLSIFSSAISRVGIDNLLLEQGPFTVMAPSNEALLRDGIGESAILSASGSWLSSMVKYHVLEGYYDLNKFPFLFNQEIETANGTPMYVTRWLRGQDTVITVNGIEVSYQALKTSNGLVFATDRVLGGGIVQESVVDYIKSNAGIALFAQALVRSGLEDELRQLPSCTVFAPSNSAMVEFGYGTVQDVHAADPIELQQLISYHIQPERRFMNDYQLVITSDQALPTNGSVRLDYYNPNTGAVTEHQSFNAVRGELALRMLDGNRTDILYDTGTANISGTQTPIYRISIRDMAGGLAIVSLMNKDYVSKNGTVHVINKVLKRLQ